LLGLCTRDSHESRIPFGRSDVGLLGRLVGKGRGFFSRRFLMPGVLCRFPLRLLAGRHRFPRDTMVAVGAELLYARAVRQRRDRRSRHSVAIGLQRLWLRTLFLIAPREGGQRGCRGWPVMRRGIVFDFVVSFRIALLV
jgi:hypothetical protein